MRYFFEISYHGGRYSGWQSQRNATGVQAVVEETLSKLFRETIEVTASGRTDAGVHCEKQYFHCDIEQPFEKALYLQKINSFLPKDIAIRAIHEVTPSASARYDAIERSYRYEITKTKNPFLEGLAWHYFKEVDLLTMNRAADLLRGEHDFESFSKVKTDVNHFVCDIKKAVWRQQGDRLYFDISANRFLRGMVRAIVGTLLDVGTEKITVNEFSNVIKSRDRKKAGANVPPVGLYLISVQYPPNIFINH